MVDAVRESRVLISLLTPIILAVLYNVMFPENKVFEAKVAYVGPETSAIVETLKTRAEAGQSVSLKLQHVASVDDARRLVASKDVDVAFVLPDGVDAAVRAGATPTSARFEPEPGGAPASFVEWSLDAGIRALAPQKPPATIATERVATGGSSDEG